MDRGFYDPDKVCLEFKYYQWVVGFFVLCYLMANIFAIKESKIFIFTFLAGTLCYPLSYCICDIVTEVYGFQRSRQLIYFGILCSYCFVFFLKIADALPSDNHWRLQEPFHQIFDTSMTRFFIASTAATIVGHFINCKIISKLKIKIKKWMLFRFVSATAIGSLADTATFIFIAFLGTRPFSWIMFLLLTQYCLNFFYSALMSPVSVRVSNYLKKAEKSDIYDTNTNFSPLRLQITYTKENNFYGRDKKQDDDSP